MELFTLEELDASQHKNKLAQEKTKASGFAKSEYDGAMNRSWPDIDGPSDPQQYLVLQTMTFIQRFGMDTAISVRLAVVEQLIKHYQIAPVLH